MCVNLKVTQFLAMHFCEKWLIFIHIEGEESTSKNWYSRERLSTFWEDQISALLLMLFCFYRQLPHIMTAAQAMTASRYCSNLLFIIQVRWTKHLGRMNPTILHEKITTCGLDAYSTAVAAEQKPSSNTTVPVMCHTRTKKYGSFLNTCLDFFEQLTRTERPVSMM